MNTMPGRLLAADEPAPVTVHNENSLSPFLLVVDHAGNSMPRALDRLGVAETECERHIAWDIGIGAVCRVLADALDAILVEQNYSRLVIDCNRTPGSETSIPEISELTVVPGNIGLSEGEREARVRCAALACWRALQSRSTFRPARHGAAEMRRGARRRRQ
jgi:predicted N-formylglutamate amidohydrolase